MWNSVKLGKKLLRYLYIIYIKLTHRKVLLATTLFQILCVCLFNQILDRLDKGNLLQTIGLIALNSHIINNI